MRRLGMLTVMVPAIAIVVTGGLALADFTERSEFGTGATIPVAWGDYDGDEDLDLAVGNFNQQNWLFINNGDTTFTQQDQFGHGS